MKGKTKLYYGIVVVVIAAVFFFTGMGVRSGNVLAQNNAQPTSTVVINDKGGFANAISDVANALMPAVVHIDITGTIVQKVPTFGFPFGNDPFFRYFFGPQAPQQERKVPIRALGSGVIISKKGYIITNNHVVEHAKTIEVELYDGTKEKAKLIGRDPQTDLAVIKIRPTSNMRYAKLGDSSKLKVGQWVIAIGCPRGLDWTVTAGIVSAKHREIGAYGPTGYEDFIQTDAAINPGNSGGPLIDLKGEVVGINSLIVSTTRGSEGLGFAIPSNMVRRIANELIKHGKVVRGYLGISIQSLTPEMAKGLGIKKNIRGVIVASVMPGSPADRAGIEQGDIIIAYEGKKIKDVSQLRMLVANTQPGKIATLKVIRGRRTLNIKVKVGNLSRMRKKEKVKKVSAVLGVNVEKVTPQLARELGLRKAEGVIITSVIPGSVAQRSGLEKGDIILRVGNKEVNSVSEFKKYISEAAKTGGVVLLVRDGKTGEIGYLTIPLR